MGGPGTNPSGYRGMTFLLFFVSVATFFLSKIPPYYFPWLAGTKKSSRLEDQPQGCPACLGDGRGAKIHVFSALQGMHFGSDFRDILDNSPMK